MKTKYYIRIKKKLELLNTVSTQVYLPEEEEGIQARAVYTIAREILELLEKAIEEED